MEQKYLLSEKYDELALDFVEIQEFLSTEKSLEKEVNKTNHLLGIGSPLLSVATLGLYDQEDLMKKYPHGVVTESFVLIPAEQFQEVKEKSTYDKENPHNKFAIGNIILYLNQYMLNFLEMTLNIELPKEDKEKMGDNLIQIIGRQAKIIATKDMIQNTPDRQIIKIAEQPEKTTNRELLKLIEGQGYSMENRLRNAINIEQDVKEIIKNNEQYIKGIEVLENKVKEISIKDVNEKISLEEFSDILDKTYSGTVSKVVPLKIVNKKIDNLIKEYDLDVKGFITESKKELFPFMHQLEPLPFKLAMEHIFKEVFYSNAKDAYTKPRFLNKDLSEIKKEFAVELVQGCNEVQREYLITIISGFDLLSISTLRLTSDRKKSKLK